MEFDGRIAVSVLRDRVVVGLTSQEAIRFVSSLVSFGYNRRDLTNEYLDSGRITL